MSISQLAKSFKVARDRFQEKRDSFRRPSSLIKLRGMRMPQCPSRKRYKEKKKRMSEEWVSLESDSDLLGVELLGDLL
jgi:hypothetical protein